MALASAWVLKRLQRPGAAGQDNGTVAFNATVYEVSLIVMAAYAAYLVAEVRWHACPHGKGSSETCAAATTVIHRRM